MQNIDDFEAKYTYDSSVASSEFDQEDSPGQFETYGPDLQYVLNVNRVDPQRVWTAVDGDDGIYLISGMLLVDRIYYIITNEHAESEDECYSYDNFLPHEE